MPTTRIEIENANGKWVANVEVGGIAARRYADAKPTFIEAMKFVWDTIKERQPEAIGGAKTPPVLMQQPTAPAPVIAEARPVEEPKAVTASAADKGIAKIDAAPEPDKQTTTSGSRSKAQRTFAAPSEEGNAETA